MASLEEIRATRLAKLEKLKAEGKNPYPASTSRTHEVVSALEQYEQLAEKGERVVLSGRVMSLRPQGGLIFFHFEDGSGRMQALLKKGEKVADNDFDMFAETVDVGDFVEVSGTLFTTKRNEKTVQVENWTMLSKSLRPLPDKWHGLQDTEERFRRRYLDILFNPEVKDLIQKRAIFWNATREFLINEGFMEVETPVLETTTGGADARPFKTHHNALDIDVYMRISAGELWQKQLMVAGFPKTFEIGRIFRNEGISPEHLQDYTQMEFYWAYADSKKGMELVERLYKHVAMETFGTLKFTIGAFEVDLGKKWELYDYRATIKEIAGVDITITELKKIEERLKELGVEYDKKGWNMYRAMDTLWKYCRKQIAGPGFLVGTPKSLSPLSKSDPENLDLTLRFQPIIAGSELGNGYSELNDPIDQAERFAEQEKMREAGDDEAQMNAREFVEALEYGMPPTCGFGFSERVFAFLANKPVREAQIFPLLRPKGDEEGSKRQSKDM